MTTTIVIADDHPVFRQGLCQLLAKEKGLKVVGEADDGQMAIELVRRRTPDLVVMDINMPNLDGIEATRQILADAPDTKVVALSVHSGKQFVRDMIAAGALGYILKGSTPREMIKGIRSVLSGNVFLSEPISKLLLSDYKTLISDPQPERDVPPEPLLYTKLCRPPISADVIPRVRLIELLEDNVQNPMTLIAAPAGYGKSTLASQWLAISELPGTWVSLDDSDNDLRVFLSYVLEAIRTVYPEHEFKTKPFVGAANLPSLGAIARYLLNDLEAVPKRFILLVDDYHCIHNPKIHEFVTELLVHPSSKLHLALLTRRDPPLPLTNLRARRNLTEVPPSHLRFTISETKSFLERFLHITITDKTAQIIEDKIEGWATGLYLAALSIRNEGDQERLTTGLLETSQYVREYLIQEVLSQAPPPFDRYLLHTAILDRFCAPLCDFLLSVFSNHNQAEYHTDGQAFIDWLNKRHMFIIALDESNRWFRYHHLFQEFLNRQLQHSAGAQETAALHSRAAEWFESQGLFTESIEHCLAAGDVLGAARIIERYRHDEHSRDRWHVVERWLARLPDDIKQQRPGLLMAQAWIAFCRFQMEQIPIFIEQAESVLAAQPADPLIQGELDFFRGNHLYWLGEAENAQNYLEKASSPTFAKLAPYGECNRLLLLSLAYCMLGQENKASRILEDHISSPVHQADGVFVSTLIGGKSFIHLLSGDLQQLGHQAQQMQVVTQKSSIRNLHVWSWYLEAIGRLHCNELVQASDLFKFVVKQRYIFEPRAALDAFAGLVLAQQLMQQPDNAVETMGHLMDFAHELNDPQSLSLAHSCRARLSLLQGDLGSAVQWALLFDEIPAPSALFLWLEVPTITQARVLIADGSEDSLIRAAELLYDLQKVSDTCCFTGQLIEVGVLQSMLLEKQGHADAALAGLKEAVVLAEAGGWVRPFVEAGRPMADLLERLHRQRDPIVYIELLLASFPDDIRLTAKAAGSHPQAAPHEPGQSSKPLQSLVEPLTNRELDVLELLGQRFQTKEIASKLCISAETVKSHLKNIFQKLNVTNRRKAVESAKALNLLP